MNYETNQRAVHTPANAYPTEAFGDAADAVTRLSAIYEANTSFLRDAFARYRRNEPFDRRVRACYPFVRVRTETNTHVDSRRSYGFVAGPGVFETTVTRPDLFGNYYREQLRLLVKNHHVSVEVGVSDQPIPIHFAFAEGIHLEGDLDRERLLAMRDVFDSPDLALLDDRIVNGTYEPLPGEPHPLALFTAARVDFSLHRLKHYTATSPTHCQNYVLYTNYQFYIDEFVKLGRTMMAKTDDADLRAYRSEYTSFVEPGDVITYNANLGEQDDEGNAPPRLPQMPAYHLKRADGSGITMINIGVGPSNAKTITDHIAVLRPHAWIMLGHCAGLRNTQRLGDYVLAHGYVREDHVLDDDLPLWVPIPALAEVQVALERAVAQVTQLDGAELKRVMRTGTVASVDNRNWELRDHREPVLRLSQSRAIALDMESATIAANGFRFRVPYGTLLCVSDKPLHGELKLPGMADQFYRAQVDQHLQIGVKAMEILRTNGLHKLHSRKLRSFAEVAFQ
ncbi:MULTISPECIES: AMP nucleosidase [Paraburkholderia]|jgi:AMP nucleosidase|uniref:AMP nucleosidase n=1 Tax=Paraburkholderia largidicola TaxID=3014751 RepID=A0A7I8BV14_9BURK|nr:MULTISPECIES: AMP nucleosidase [Paraburkholderia]BEU23496.1 AMP nucleosidase [Paraburkholderia sp. 22B1P]GJH33797.1 AMP nucleosidase [Paraburkholderia hospita]CAG9263971.1 AMP nucleosidase [Paraburkholderia caribensis]BCF92088.1 AMP nucleosidase [Paraburkholderia sp. PGU16]GJH05161.1 AMP nucleosidase [Paraburkholderia terrae]